MKPIIFCLLALSLFGCAFRAAMQRGEQAERSGEWHAALTAYRQALAEDPDDPVALAARERAAEGAHRAALKRFDHALKAGDLATAAKQLGLAKDAAPNAASTLAARRALSDAEARRAADNALAKAATLERAGELAEALRSAHRGWQAQANPTAEAAVARLGAALAARADTHESKKNYRAALSDRRVLAAIGAPLPAPTPQQSERQTRARWAQDLTARAEAAKGLNTPSIRALLLAQRAHILPDEPSRRAARQALSEIPTAHYPSVHLDIDGPRPARQAATRQLEKVGFPKGQTRFAMTVTLDPGACRDSHVDKVRSARYQSGTRLERNPDWDRAVAALDAEIQTLQRLADAEAEALDALEDAEDAYARLDGQTRKKTAKARSRAHKRLRDAKAAEAAAWQTVKRRPDAQQARRALENAQRDVEAAYERLDRIDAKAEGRAERELRQVLARRKVLRARRRETREQRQRVSAARRRLRRQPPEIEVPAFANHRYLVTHWTRRCSTHASYALEGPLAPKRDVLQLEETFQDVAHAAQLELALDENPVRLGPPPAASIAALYDAAGKALAKALKAEVHAWAAQLLKNAQASEDDEHAAEALLAAWRLGGTWAKPAAAKLLRQRFDVDIAAVEATVPKLM